MTTLDLVVIGVYFALVMAIGFYFSGRTRTAKGYFLAGRQVGWVAIGASLFATNISSEHLIGLAGSGASTGLAVGHFEWLAVFMVLALGWIFVPFYLRSGVATMPEFLERRYGPAARMYLTMVSVIAYIFTKISVSLYAGSLVMREVAGWDFYTSALVMVLTTGAYTIVGGLAAVIYTELLQAVVLIGGAIILTAIGLSEAGGFAGLRANLPAGFFHMIKPASDPDFPWTGIFLGAPILGIWYWCTDQVIVQRVLSAKDEAQARGGAIFSGFLKILPVFILVLPGMIARVLYPDIQGDQAYPALVVRLLPSGLTGLMIAALMAALMSSLAATFNSASTLITLDLYQRIRPNASERRLVFVGRASTVLMVGLGILWVPFIPYMSGQVYIYLQSVQAYISPPIAAVFLLGVLWPRANRWGAIASLLTGAVIGGTRFVLEVGRQNPLVAETPWLTRIVEIHFLHFAVLMFIISTLVLVGVSLATGREAESKLRGLTFATLQEPYTALAGARSTVILQIAASVIVSGTVFVLWWYFA
ncbi:MAG TPA: sodium:solute symporter [Vicinamibacterales bacterium]|nr:sodium:solute symporter [Vicinamibacterales bacterium]